MDIEKFDNLLDPNIPLTFSDGTEVYEKLSRKFITHKMGYFIVAPSGAGKTHFIRGQVESHWVDGDILWQSTDAHPDEAWWQKGDDRITEIDQRSDIITIEAKKLGFWIIGASNNFLKPDAIVVPDWEVHKGWILKRENEAYDGGVTSDQLDQVIKHRETILMWEKAGVPRFESVAEATAFLASK